MAEKGPMNTSISVQDIGFVSVELGDESSITWTAHSEKRFRWEDHEPAQRMSALQPLLAGTLKLAALLTGCNSEIDHIVSRPHCRDNDLILELALEIAPELPWRHIEFNLHLGGGTVVESGLAKQTICIYFDAYRVSYPWNNLDESRLDEGTLVQHLLPRKVAIEEALVSIASQWLSDSVGVRLADQFSWREEVEPYTGGDAFRWKGVIVDPNDALTRIQKS